MTSRLRFSLGLSRWIVLACLVFSGCSSEELTGKLKGSVTFNGKPVTEGIANLMNQEFGRAYSAPLGPDGTFEIKDPVIVGSYVVFIAPPIGAAPTIDAPVVKEVNPENIPAKYRSEKTTDLKADIIDGENNLNFDMKT